MVSVAIHTARRERIATRNRLAVERPGIHILLGRMAGATLYLRRRIVRKILAFEISVAASTSKTRMDGSRKFFPIDVQRNGFAAPRRGRASVAVAGKTLRPGLFGFARRSRFALGGAHGTLRKQKGQGYSEKRRSHNPQTSLPLFHS